MKFSKNTTLKFSAYFYQAQSGIFEEGVRTRAGSPSTHELNIWCFEISMCSLSIHSRSKCLVWVKKCCHIWLDQNFDPSLLTKKLWPFYMRMKQKKIFFLKKKFQNGRLKKSLFSKITNSQKIFMKISWIGPWVSRIE